MIPYLKPALIAVTVTAIGTGGWLARGWFEDSKSLAAMEAQQALADSIRTDMNKVVSTVEGQLKGLKANERIIDRGIIREIQKPVYRNVCLPNEAIKILNTIADGGEDAKAQ